LSSYKVTFIADYFVLSTTVDVDGNELVNNNSSGTMADMVFSDQVIGNKANEMLRDEYGFAPLGFCYDVEIEEVSYA
jgi:hypothetical protein